MAYYKINLSYEIAKDHTSQTPDATGLLLYNLLDSAYFSQKVIYLSN
jgi:hypothetical protein